MVDAVIRRDYGRLLVLLSSQRFSIDIPDPVGRTALHWTVIFGETAMLADLLAAGADPNRADLAGRTPLAVLHRGDRIAAELLLAAGADPDAADRAARTPREQATGAVLATINQLAPPTSRTRVEGRVIDHPVGVPIIDAICTGNTQWLRDELAAGVDPDTTTTTGWTALMWAAHLDHPTHARILLDAGADPNRRDTFGNNALTAAIFGPSPAVMRVLLDRGADPRATNNYGTSPADTVARLVRQDYKDLFAEAGCRR